VIQKDFQIPCRLGKISFVVGTGRKEGLIIAPQLTSYLVQLEHEHESRSQCTVVFHPYHHHSLAKSENQVNKVLGISAESVHVMEYGFSRLCSNRKGRFDS
jgi:hypothetical protein